MRPVEQLRAWSYRRQHLDRSAGSPLAALQRVLAVHSTHPPAPLSLLARTVGFEYATFETIEREKQAVRLPVMRGSVHLMPTGFAPAMLAATRAGSNQLMKRLGTNPEDSRTFDELRAALLPLLDQPVAGSNIRETLGITEREFMAIRLMTRSGDVLRLSTNPRADRLMYVATESWLGSPLVEPDPNEARSWLASAYFDAFGPARLKDLSWWFSASQRDAKAAIEGLDLVEVADELLIPGRLTSTFATTQDLEPEAIAVVPKWDSYPMGYAPDGRGRFVDDRHLTHAYTTTETSIGATTGDGHPLILKGGRAVARWQHRFTARTMAVTVVPFPGESIRERQISDRFEEIAALMSCDRVMVTIDRPS